MSASVDRLREMMRLLRAPEGCGWSRAQDHRSLAPYAIEEAHELAEAIDAGVEADLVDELADLLFQVVFHAELGAERDAFDLDTIAERLAAKLAARTPHVFGPEARAGVDIEEIEISWDQIKGAEKPERTSALDGIPERLPELARAQKLIRRAHRAGLRGSADAGQHADERIGAELMALITRAEEAGVDAEGALRRARRRGEEALRSEEQARGHGNPLDPGPGGD